MKVGLAGRDLNAPADYVSAVFSPAVFTGFACYGLGAIIWLGALSRLPLSVAYPLTSLAVALVVVVSALALHEPMSWLRIGGVATIMGGLVAVGLSR